MCYNPPMVAAAHQPQYLPWLGYFDKMARCDVFIYLDDVQYKKREFQNRNRVRVKNGEQWLTVPVASKGRYTQAIHEVEIEGTAWAKDHWTALTLAYAKAPFFKQHAGELDSFYKRPWPLLGPMNEALADFHRQALGIQTPLRRSSEFNVQSAKTERLVALCRAVGADTYLSGQGARDYLQEELFQKAGIRVVYQEFAHPAYPQAYEGFHSHLAALDLIFNCGPEAGKILLRNTR